MRDIQIPRRATSEDIREALKLIRDADVTLVGTIDAEQDQSQVDLIRELIKDHHRPVVISLRTPYDLRNFPMVTTYLCAYGIRPVSMEAAARVLSGEIEPQGVLPCTIPDIADA